ncbi:MAG: hypothetical protein LC649_07270, partial [Bacteroidales bacterium]|nr:hypothetical protein [Bacteroidales bacterium]
LVSYVWAGIGCTFSVVILFTLFWERFHGRAALVTIVTGLLFTVFWISGGFEQHYRVTSAKTLFLVEQGVLEQHEASLYDEMEGRKYISASAFESDLLELLGEESTGPGVQPGESVRERLPAMVSSYTEKGIPARLLTFFVALGVAIASTFLLKKREHKVI